MGAGGQGDWRNEANYVVLGNSDAVRLRGGSRGEDFVAAAGGLEEMGILPSGFIAVRCPAANGLSRIFRDRG
jgi:hypothetical protein